MRALVLTILSGIAAVWMTASAAWAAGEMSAEEARAAALAGKVTLVDIRTPEEWENTGVPDVAHLLNMHEDGFASRLLALYEAHPDRPMAVICATGARSTYVTTALEQRGLTRLLNVREGMMGSKHGPGWLRRSLPIRKAGTPMVTN